MRCRAWAATEALRCENLKRAGLTLNPPVQVEILSDSPSWATYKTEFEIKSELGKAPDIVVSTADLAEDWKQRGFIRDLESAAPAFKRDLFKSFLWVPVQIDSKTWGVPQDYEMRLLYFHKASLRKLGWSEQKIQDLPADIQSGTFSWAELLKTSEQAVKGKIVGPGRAFWHRPKNGLVHYQFYLSFGGAPISSHQKPEAAAAQSFYGFLSEALQKQLLPKDLLQMSWPDWDRNLAQSEDPILFFVAGSWAPYILSAEFKHLSPEKFFEQWGYALLPRSKASLPVRNVIQTHYYFVSSQSKDPALAFRLIEAASQPEWQGEHALQSGHLSVLKSSSEAYRKQAFFKYMEEHMSQPEPLPVPGFRTWENWLQALFQGIIAVEHAGMSSEQATRLALDRMRLGSP